MEVNNNWLPIQGKYYDIDIDLNGRTYEVVELDEKPETALTTLEKIEKIIGLNFKPLNLHDSDKIIKICRHMYQDLQTKFHSSLIKHDPAKVFCKITEHIHQELHSTALYCLTNDDKMKKINALHIRIERALYPSISLPGLDETNQLILNFLTFKNLNFFCVVNRDAKKLGDINIVQRAKQLDISRKYLNYGIELSYEYIRDMFKQFDWIKRMSKLEQINNFENILKVLNLKAPDLFKLISNEFAYICAQDAISFIANQKVEDDFTGENKEEFSEKTFSLGEEALMIAYKKKLNLEFLLKRGAVINVNTTDFEKNTFLHLASKKNDCQFLNVLLAKKPNVNCQNSNLITPLHLAKSFEFVNLLIESGADVNSLDKFGRSALYTAKTPEIAKLLIEKGANVNLNDNEGRTALHYAKTPQMIEFFLGMGLDINQCDAFKCTPLHYVVTNNCGFDCVKLLLDNDAEIDFVNSRGYTALQEAKNFNRSDDIIQLLETRKTITTECTIS